MSVESRTADTILQEKIKVQIGGKEYNVAKPTLRTLLLVSKDIAGLMDEDIEDKENIVPCILEMINHDAERQARIIATFILGANNIKVWEENVVKRKIFGIEIHDTIIHDNLQELTNEILDNIGCKKANEVISECLSFGDIGFFLQTSISLRGANLSKPTKI